MLPIFLWLTLALSAAVNFGLTKEELQHLDNDPAATHIVSFEIGKYSRLGAGEDERWGTLEIALFGETVPLTVSHFVSHCNAAEMGYTGSIFHRIVKDFVVQGGNIIRGNDDKLKVQLERFEDENFTIKHSKRGRLSMANAGPNTNGAQYFITTGDQASFLDGKHVVFGQLVLGFDVLDKMNAVETDKLDRPTADVTVTMVKVRTLDEKEAEPAATADEPMGRGYLVFIFFCLAASVGYGVLQWNRRRQVVNITSFRM